MLGHCARAGLGEYSQNILRVFDSPRLVLKYFSIIGDADLQSQFHLSELVMKNLAEGKYDSELVRMAESAFLHFH